MTDKELRKLKRVDLIEILYYLEKEVERLQEENKYIKEQLNVKLSLTDEDIRRIAAAVTENKERSADEEKNDENTTTDE